MTNQETGFGSPVPSFAGTLMEQFIAALTDQKEDTFLAKTSGTPVHNLTVCGKSLTMYSDCNHNHMVTADNAPEIAAPLWHIYETQLKVASKLITPAQVAALAMPYFLEDLSLDKGDAGSGWVAGFQEAIQQLLARFQVATPCWRSIQATDEQDCVTLEARSYCQEKGTYLGKITVNLDIGKTSPGYANLMGLTLLSDGYLVQKPTFPVPFQAQMNPCTSWPEYMRKTATYLKIRKALWTLEQTYGVVAQMEGTETSKLSIIIREKLNPEIICVADVSMAGTVTDDHPLCKVFVWAPDSIDKSMGRVLGMFSLQDSALQAGLVSELGQLFSR